MALKNAKIFEAEGEWYFEVTILMTRAERLAAFRKSLARARGNYRKVLLEYLRRFDDPAFGDDHRYAVEGPFATREAAESFHVSLERIKNGNTQDQFCLDFSGSLVTAAMREEFAETMKTWKAGDGLPPLPAEMQRHIDIAHARITKEMRNRLEALEQTGNQLI